MGRSRRSPRHQLQGGRFRSGRGREAGQRLIRISATARRHRRFTKWGRALHPGGAAPFRFLFMRGWFLCGCRCRPDAGRAPASTPSMMCAKNAPPLQAAEKIGQVGVIRTRRFPSASPEAIRKPRTSPGAACLCKERERKQPNAPQRPPAQGAMHGTTGWWVLRSLAPDEHQEQADARSHARVMPRPCRGAGDRIWKKRQQCFETRKREYVTHVRSEGLRSARG